MLKVGVQNGETIMEAGKIMREERGKVAKVYQRSSYCIVMNELMKNFRRTKMKY